MLLRSNYEGVPWTEIVESVAATQDIVDPDKNNSVASTVQWVVRFGQDKVIGAGRDKVLETLGLTAVSKALAIVGAARQINATVSWFVSTADKQMLEGQMDRYFLAREAGFTQEDINNRTEEGKSGGTILYDDSGWILSVNDRNTRIPPHPGQMKPRQAWEICERVWQLKQDSGSFERDKKKIGDAIGQAVLAKAAPISQTPRIIFSMGDELMAQSVTGGSTEPASDAEKRIWRARSSAIPLASPNGKYKVIAKKNAELSDEVRFRIVNGHTGVEVLSAQRIQRAFGDRYYMDYLFDGWLPASRHFAVMAHGHISSNENYSRCVIDVVTGRIIKFNGWLSPNGQVAIVPSQENMMEDQIDHIAADNYFTNGDLDYFAVKMPPLSRYKIAGLTRRKLILDGKRFSLTSYIDNSTTASRSAWDNNAKIPRLRAVLFEFSRDNKWALYHTSFYGASNAANTVDFLISLETGRVQKLKGVKATFL